MNSEPILFLFPSDYFHPHQVDETYLAESISLQQAGFPTAVISLESLSADLAQIYPTLISTPTMIYRGWMLSASDHQKLIATISQAGACAYTSTADYLATHYLPNWYHSIKDLTPETHFYHTDGDLKNELTKLGWDRFFVKDYVKSLKTSMGSIISHPAEINLVIAEMHKFRGTIEGGICIRRVEDFIPTTEQRYFVIDGKVFAADRTATIPAIAIDCAGRIKSRFFSIDIIDRQDGVKRIVEIGDGQVSSLVGWSVDRFVEICHSFN
jgi:ATP-grasp domain, R2K clade family 3